MDNSVRIPLDLPDVRVLGVSKTEQGDWLIRIESTLEGTRCHRCGRQIMHFHGFDQAIRGRHLPVFGQPVLIEFDLSVIGVISATTDRRQRNG